MWHQKIVIMTIEARVANQKYGFGEPEYRLFKWIYDYERLLSTVRKHLKRDCLSTKYYKLKIL